MVHPNPHFILNIKLETTAQLQQQSPGFKSLQGLFVLVALQMAAAITVCSLQASDSLGHIFAMALNSCYYIAHFRIS